MQIWSSVDLRAYRALCKVLSSLYITMSSIISMNFRDLSFIIFCNMIDIFKSIFTPSCQMKIFLLDKKYNKVVCLMSYTLYLSFTRGTLFYILFTQ